MEAKLNTFWVVFSIPTAAVAWRFHSATRAHRQAVTLSKIFGIGYSYLTLGDGGVYTLND